MSDTFKHPQIENGWFREKPVTWPGQAFCLEVKRVLHHENSLQDVLIFESTTYGRVLALDGVIQCTERDEFAYQEMIAHLPLCSHPNPQKVLVIGGGDGGVLREVAKHECVEEITLCDIDDAVIKASKKYLPKMAVGFDNPKVHVNIGDGFEYLKNKIGAYDVIITDSSDPVGPAETLFKRGYYELVRNSLKPGGIACAQGECQWLDLQLICDIQRFSKELFPVVEYASTMVPTYPTGQIGFALACKEAGRDLRKPLRRFTPEQEARLFKYYNAQMHESAFVLPQFVQSALAGK